jgi:DNA-binding transcriptional ArsR family regulator
MYESQYLCLRKYLNVMYNCIRECADINQLNKCKQDIHQAIQPIQKIANILNLAGNEVRLKILYLLHLEGRMCPCDLSDVLEMTVPAISQHLKKLWKGEVLNKKKEGKTIFYSLNQTELNLLLPMFAQISDLSAATKK